MINKKERIVTIELVDKNITSKKLVYEALKQISPINANKIIIDFAVDISKNNTASESNKLLIKLLNMRTGICKTISERYGIYTELGSFSFQNSNTDSKLIVTIKIDGDCDVD